MQRIQTNISNISSNEAGPRRETAGRSLVFRDRIDLLRARSDLLVGKDRLLMKMYLDNGNTFRQMARLVGVNEATISRRIYKVTERLLNSEYITCLRNRDRFSSTEMGVAKDYFLKGLSQREIAKQRDRSLYRIRMILKKIQVMVSVEGSDNSYRRRA